MSRPKVKPDARAELDPLLAEADLETRPWEYDASEDRVIYRPDRKLLKRLMAVPIEQGHAEKQTTGRLAGALDTYLAHELRRAGFTHDSVFPRARQPRVLPTEAAALEAALARLDVAIAESELPRGSAVHQAADEAHAALPGAADARILGRFYRKQVDVAVSRWDTGPLLLISGKTQVKSFRNNTNNRYEEAIGEAVNLRDRYPMTALGYAFLARDSINDSPAYERVCDLLARLRQPDGPFDATVLLIASWSEDPVALRRVTDPASELTLPRFFEDLLGAFANYTPAGLEVHDDVRQRMTLALESGRNSEHSIDGSAMAGSG